MKLSMFGLVALTLLASSIAAAQPPTSDDIYNSLTRQLDVWQGRQLVADQVADIKMQRAVAWINGVYGAAQLLTADEKSKIRICMPYPMEQQVPLKIYVHYMDAHPDTHQLSPVTVAVASAADAFPCPKK